MTADRSKTYARARWVAVFGLVVAVGMALLVGAPVANATPGKGGVTTETVSVNQEQPTVYYLKSDIQPIGDALGVTRATSVAQDADAIVVKMDGVGPASRAQCDGYQVCLWTGDYFSGSWIGFTSTPGGSLVNCRGWRFENTVWQDHVWSILNRTAGITIWDRAHDGSFNYTKYGYLPRNYEHDTAFTHIMDAWVYEPNNNCSNIYLTHI